MCDAMVWRMSVFRVSRGLVCDRSILAIGLSTLYCCANQNDGWWSNTETLLILYSLVGGNGFIFIFGEAFLRKEHAIFALFFRVGPPFSCSNNAHLSIARFFFCVCLGPVRSKETGGHSTRKKTRRVQQHCKYVLDLFFDLLLGFIVG